MNLVTVQGRGNVYKLARDHNNIIIIIMAVKLDWGAWAKDNTILYILHFTFEVAFGNSFSNHLSPMN